MTQEATRVGLDRSVGWGGLLMWALGSVLAGLASCGPASTSSDWDAAIGFYRQKVARDPRLYPAYAQLGASYLARARVTLDPTDVAAAREALDRSVQIQPSFAAYKTMAAVSNFSHRFNDAIRWAQRAHEASPEDGAVTAQLVEAYLGLGRIDDAAALLQLDQPPADYYRIVAMGHWLAAQPRMDDAVDAYVAAAQLAREAQVDELAVWAQVRAAGLVLDAGRADEARQYLEAGARLRPDDFWLRVHQAELREAEGRLDEALAIYERLLRQTPNPTIHAQAWAVARRLGRPDRARRHFKAADAGLRRALDTGEVYTLEALAALYLEADVELDRARELAQRNLEFNPDASARALLASIEQRLDAAGLDADSP